MMQQGIWTKHLQFYLDNANSAASVNKYRGFLGSQESAVYHYGTNSAGDIGSVWYAPDAVSVTTFTMRQESSDYNNL